jgi:hypothetical protein
MSTVFKQLNTDWNAQPNATSTRVTINEDEVVLAFYMNAYQFPAFREDDIGYLRFANAWRYRIGTVSDEDFYRGGCRFSKLAPAWGEFYEVSGDLLLKLCPNDWTEVGPRTKALKHFLFYFRDEEFEIDAESWMLQVCNARREITMERMTMEQKS